MEAVWVVLGPLSVGVLAAATGLLARQWLWRLGRLEERVGRLSDRVRQIEVSMARLQVRIDEED